MKRALALIVFAACSPVERVAWEGEADTFAVVELDAEGRVARASGLALFDGTNGISFFGGEGRSIFVGWSRSVLEELGAPVDPLLLSADRLEAASGCLQTLPPPTVALEAGAGAVDPASVAALTVRWIRDTCPLVQADDFAFDIDCKKFRCVPRATRRSRCQFDFLLDCDYGEISGTLDRRGTLCLEGKGEITCEAQGFLPPAIGAAECSRLSCDIEAHLSREPLPLEVAEIPLRPGAATYSPPLMLSDNLPFLPNLARYIGHVWDFAISGDRVAVSTNPLEPGPTCTLVQRGFIDIYDTETLQLFHHTDGPPCLFRLAADTSSTAPGWIGMFLEGNDYKLSRFRADGTQRFETTVLADPRSPLMEHDPPRVEGRPTVLGVFGEPARLVMAALSRARPGSYVYVYDPVTLMPLSHRLILGRQLTSATAIDATTIALGDASSSSVVWFDLSTGSERSMVTLPAEFIRSDDWLTDVAYLPAHDRVLMTIGKRNAATYAVDEDRGIISRAVIFDHPAVPVAALGWPAAPGLALVQATYQLDLETWPAVLAFFDVERGKYLPGTLEIGHGAAGSMIADDRGRVWILLPWEPKLIRVEPPR